MEKLVDPADLVLKYPPSPFCYDNQLWYGDTTGQAKQAGWLTPQTIPPVADGFVRTFGQPAWSNAGDGTAAPVYHDTSLADIQAAQAAAAQKIADDAAAAAVKQAEDNAAAYATTLPQRQAVAGLMQMYAYKTQQFCAAAGLAPVNVLTMDAIQAVSSGLTVGSAAYVQCLALAVTLEALRTRLIGATDDQKILDSIPLAGPIDMPTV